MELYQCSWPCRGSGG